MWRTRSTQTTMRRPVPGLRVAAGWRGLAGWVPVRTQVTFDCGDPHAQAVFWSQVYGTVVEDHSVLVDQLVADGRMPVDDRVLVDGRSAFRDVAACRDPTGVEPRLFFQRVPEAKIAKNRVHLDVHVGADQKPERGRTTGRAWCATGRNAQRPRAADLCPARPGRQRVLPALGRLSADESRPGGRRPRSGSHRRGRIDRPRTHAT